MSGWGKLQERLQGLGRALMLPIAVLPVAGLLLRLGQPDLLDMSFVATAGQSIFANLGLLFAIGVGVGLARENNGAAGLAGAVAYVVLTEGAKVLMQVPTTALPPGGLDVATREALLTLWKEKELSKLSVPAGIICGLAAGSLYNRFHDIRFPEYLSFFGGRRFVPIISGMFGLVGAAAFGFGFPALEAGVDQLSLWVAQSGSIGLFLFGALNRILIVTGLHHILNNIAWFVVGDYQGVTGDLNRFFAGDPAAGAFMTGFFPVMMFGLPAACLAMWRAARPDRRKAVGGMLLSMALTSFLTGVTEPIEFTFMFLAPALYGLHALLTGASMALMDALGVKIGFGFSAGLFDYVLNYSQSTKPWMLIPVGVAYAAVYYVTFSYAIRLLNLSTPGRELEGQAPEVHGQGADNPAALPAAYVAALGGAENLLEISACTTRLRLILKDRSLASEAHIKGLGAKAVLNIGEKGLQVVIGPESDRIASAMRALINLQRAEDEPQVEPAKSADKAPALDPKLMQWLGGSKNIINISGRVGRLVVAVADPQLVSNDVLQLPVSTRGFRAQSGAYHFIETD
ncbi:MAG: PTS N-acetyl-D-glucosamine transporter [Sphingomonadales bacterium 35-56-22]|jgi:PTS system N-acetylglucosamine-specific IIC component|nr:MAG: PTS N-acetyl-D-glucosamine transporter [Sphingomonadales bacterium 35-56-22]OYY96495.1 MAG: PTS N-acetyl-D-glucosamine transporter [Sphingomonadales bacterium 28-56-43]OYZ59366.1 MAG: PTS N-acetyl-D-glucosamine transporter [Sphingomonadales bacterium 24-56-14]